MRPMTPDNMWVKRMPSMTTMKARFPEIPWEKVFRWRKDLEHAETPEKVMELCNTLLDGCGVESLFNQSLSNPVGLWYVNMGDPYIQTLMLNDNHTLMVGCWGDWLESQERRGVHFD